MKIKNEDLERIWVTSDTHAFHKNICRGTTSWGDSGEAEGNVLGVRDFNTPEEMTEFISGNFNSLIPSDGILFHLGDWSFGGEDKVELFRSMLDVKEIHLITGNHDHHQDSGKFDKLFASRQKYLELEVGKYLKFILFHFPISSWNHIRRGAFHLHGHQHLTNDLRFGNGRMMDVGVDGNKLHPYKLTDIIGLLKDRQFISKNDHHASSS